MQLRLSVLPPGAREPVDVALTCSSGTPVGEVAAALRAAAGGPGSLFADGVPVDEDAALGSPPLLHGALLTVGTPSRPSRLRGLLQLQVVGGPDSGAVHQLEPGTLRVGRAVGADVRVDDPDVSRAHAELTVGWDGVTVRDLRSTNGTRVAGSPVGDDPVPLPLGTPLRLGASTLELAAPDLVPAATRPDGAGRLEVNRPPRIRHEPPAVEVVLPSPPQKRDRTRFPLVAVLLPLALAGVLVALFRRPEFAVFALLSPLMLGGQWFSDRLGHRREDDAARAEHARATADAHERVTAAVAGQEAAAHAEAPHPARVLLTAAGPTPALWHRRPTDVDALLLRLGTADLPSALVVRQPGTERGAVTDAPLLRQVPATVALREVGVLGLAGPAGRAMGVVRSLVVQLAVHHSPRDLAIVVLAPDDRACGWAWARWLPHLAPSAGQDCTVLVGLDADQVSHRVTELLRQLELRSRSRPARGTWPGPHTVVVLDGARALRATPGIARLLADGPAVGLYAVCVDEHPVDLPVECRARAVLEGESAAGLRLEVDGRPPVTDGTVDATPARWAERVARDLAPLRDATPEEGGLGLPDQCRLLDLLAGHAAAEPPTAVAVAARWQVRPRSTAALLGLGTEGPFSVDLRRDGPHTLVAGTTGSGKSELLQTLVASLAVSNRPDEMCFVLVDYKGGAAFAECERLPHTVGLVTDLDGHLTERALTSLEAELKRREHLLRRAGTTDLEAYQARRGPTDPPLPRLVIAVDEFATLVEELPGFVRGLVGVAQRGRSLGVHLVLATQRPAGVVSADIRANTGLRIALRVTDAGESTDVVDTPDASAISRRTPGRAYARRGAEPLVAFQTARVGGHAGAVEGVRVDVLRWPRLGDPAPRAKPADLHADAPTDLARLVDALGQAARRLQVPPVPSPWLPPLPARLTRDDLPGGVGTASLPYALVDVPSEQSRRNLGLDLAAGAHLLVAGGPRSGRSTLLRTLAAQVAEHTSSGDVHLYGIDCGNGALLPLAGLPHCGAVVSGDQGERVVRLLDRLSAEVRRRQALLAEGGYADAAEQRRHVPAAHRLPYLLVLLDRWEGFLAQLDEVDGGRSTDALLRLLGDGPAAGLRAVVTGDRSVLIGRVSSLVEDRLVLRMPDRADAALAGLTLRRLPEDQPPGRGVLAPSGLEAQVALPGADSSGPAQVALLHELARRATDRDAEVPSDLRPLRVEAVPSRVGYADLSEAGLPRTSPLWALAGVGGDAAAPLGIDLGTEGPAMVIAGPAGSGRSTALGVVAASLLEGGARVLVVAPRRSPLRRLAGHPGVAAVLTGGAGDEARLQDAAAREPGPFVVLVDDADLVADSGLDPALQAYLRGCREHDRALVLTGTTGELQAGFRGLAVQARKGRTGLVLCPDGPLDGDLLGVRLPGSLTAGGPVGRAALVVRGSVTAVQVPDLPTGPADVADLAS